MAGGKHLTFSVFSENMQRLSDVDEKVIQCAVFLRESKDIDKKSWRIFSRTIFQILS